MTTQKGGRPRNDAPQTHYSSQPGPDCPGCPHLIFFSGTDQRQPRCIVLEMFAYPCPVRAREKAHEAAPLPVAAEGWL